jgi:hypothetical protein
VIPNKESMAIFTFLLFMCISAASIVVASDNCRDVKIKITNNTTWNEIIVDRFWYYDYDVEKWRREYTWTPLKVLKGESRIRIRDLEHVDNDNTKIRIRWNRHIGTKMKDRYEETASFVCRDDCMVHIIID